jgi:hypothetical protein
LDNAIECELTILILLNKKKNKIDESVQKCIFKFVKYTYQKTVYEKKRTVCVNQVKKRKIMIYFNCLSALNIGEKKGGNK